MRFVAGYESAVDVEDYSTKQLELLVQCYCSFF